ncbi:SPOR domain-containing protein [Rhizobium sp. 18055]|uniref:SPOR domain-containing protein n=1 Tax=Rhizobium sp. 18055 TaxID=2681403 RepID=UPI001359062D|nr:SPOR domain-containing protein [Rhizobium sp. 18055]
MADKQRAYDTRDNANLFADDDPLAELARIVGFEPRVAANTVDTAPRQEPAFNLEDELLREFERYDAPTAPAIVDHPVEAAFVEPVSYAEPEPVAYAEPEPHHEATPHYEVEAVQYEAPVVPEQAVDYRAPAAEQHDASSILPSSDWASGVSRPAEPVSGGARDLIEELELSISAAPAPLQPAKAPQWSAASIRLPIANFHPSRRDQPVAAAPVPEPVAVAAAELLLPQPEVEFEMPAAASFPAEIDRHEPAFVAEAPVVEPVADPTVDHSAFDLAAAAKDGDIKADAALTEAVPEFDDIAFDIDDLLADVSQYPVAGREPAPVPAEPSAPAYVPEAPVAVAAPLYVPEPQPVVAKAAPEAEDPFAGHDFELDLEGIELELADLDFVEPVVAQEIEQPKPVIPAAVTYQPAAYQPEPAPRPTPAPVYQAPVYQAPVHQAPAPVYRSPEPVAVAAPAAPAYRAPAFVGDTAEELPFDPSMISDAEYQMEAVEMHVPTLPPVEKHEPVAAMSDFDFDVDSEIANLLAPAKPAEASAKPSAEEWRARSQAAVASTAAVSMQQPSQPQAQSFDEFERALEEDFRRSVNEPVQQRRETVSEVQIQSASDAEDMSRARSMKRMLAGAVAVVILGGVASAGYSFLARDGGLGIASGEPRVIVADKDPVKVVPENPGGKTVPNQDKAVYDSVGGAAAEAPKQKALVSSDEQPVDVVQRTLTPETLPEDNDAPMPSMATPVGDTQDPRLLPTNTANDTAVADTSDADRSPSVSARKVRTMIVRPDGTLVARDEPAPEAAASSLPKPTSVQTQKITAGSAAAPTIEQLASADIRSTPVEGTTPSPQQASENVLAKAAAATPESVNPPVRAVTSTKTDTAPVPAARPTAAAPLAPAAQTPKVPQASKEVAAVSPAATQAQPTTAAAGGYGVQIASLPSEAEAKKSYASLSKKFAGVLSGRSYEIRKADIAGKGTFYRVRIPASSKDEAAAICEKYRSAGGSCLISK